MQFQTSDQFKLLKQLTRLADVAEEILTHLKGPEEEESDDVTTSPGTYSPSVVKSKPKTRVKPKTKEPENAKSTP